MVDSAKRIDSPQGTRNETFDVDMDGQSVLVSSPLHASPHAHVPPIHSSSPPKPPSPHPSAPSGTFSATIAALRRCVARHDTKRAQQRVSDAIVRGAVAGLTLRGGLHLASYLVGLFVKPKTNRNNNNNNNKPSLGNLVRDTLRWGAFLGCFSGLFVTADESIACFIGRRRTAAWRSLAAGAIAGPTLLLTGPDTTHTSLALYVLLRGITLLVRCGNLPTASPWKRRLLTPTRWHHGDVFLMCLSTCQFGYSWIVMPSTLPPSYVRFLNKHGGKEMYVLEAIREMCHRHPHSQNTPQVLRTLRSTPYEKSFHGTLPCEFLHPGQSCSRHTLGFLPAGYLRAIPVYVPVYIIPALLVHRRKLLGPGKRGELWGKVGLGALRSSGFLALYCALAWRGACAGWNAAGRTTPMAIVASCWIAGLAVLVEKKSRRMELALYCLSRSVEAFSLTLVAHGYIHKRFIPRRLDVMLFSAAAAAICHCYSDHYGERRDVFKSKYLAVFDFILGNTGFKSAGISHAPSNTELLQMAGRSFRRSMSQLGFAQGGGAGGIGGIHSYSSGYSDDEGDNDDDNEGSSSGVGCGGENKEDGWVGESGEEVGVGAQPINHKEEGVQGKGVVG